MDTDRFSNGGGVDLDDVACPVCDGPRVSIVEILIPEDTAGASKRTLKTGMTGAAVGGVIGALLGPGGVAAGVTLGGALGSSTGLRAAEGKVVVDCGDCGARHEVPIPA